MLAEHFSQVSGFNPRAHAGRDNKNVTLRNAVTVFQSTRPRGARRPKTRSTTPNRIVSIHAPTRGATTGTLTAVSVNAGFNPRAHAGRDHYHHYQQRWRNQFQSTRPRGARQILCTAILKTAGFNPRAHAGRDTKHFQKPQMRVFQSTRPRGARQINNQTRACLRLVSIHAPTRGATYRGRGIKVLPPCFNPRAHAGRDGNSRLSPYTQIRFNPRAHAGRDTTYSHRFAPCRCFNPRAHAGRDSM